MKEARFRMVEGDPDPAFSSSTAERLKRSFERLGMDDKNSARISSNNHHYSYRLSMDESVHVLYELNQALWEFLETDKLFLPYTRPRAAT